MLNISSRYTHVQIEMCKLLRTISSQDQITLIRANLKIYTDLVG